MLLADRTPHGTHPCDRGCCTDWSPGGRNNRRRRRIARARENRAWRRWA